LPEFGQYALSVFFFDKKSSETAIADFEKVTVPVDSNAIGEVSKQTEPLIKQVITCLKYLIQSISVQMVIF